MWLGLADICMESENFSTYEKIPSYLLLVVVIIDYSVIFNIRNPGKMLKLE